MSITTRISPTHSRSVRNAGGTSNALRIFRSRPAGAGRVTVIPSHDHEPPAARLILYLLLADEYMFFRTTRDYHWNVTGPYFLHLRQQFKLQHEKSTEWVEAVSERIREMRFGKCITWTELMRSVRCACASGVNLSAEQMLSELLRSHDDLIAQLRRDTDACLQEHGDPGTAGFLAGLTEQHENAAWMLRAHFQNAE